jgi:hypothetical protein
MITVTRVGEMKALVRKWKARGLTVGFVPTMGFLHEGHLSLVRESRRRSGATAVSVFVNPTQFGPREDFSRYPRDLERDAALLEGEAVDALFLPATRPTSRSMTSRTGCAGSPVRVISAAWPRLSSNCSTSSSPILPSSDGRMPSRSSSCARWPPISTSPPRSSAVPSFGNPTAWP